MQWLVLTESEQKCKSVFNAKLQNIKVTVWGVKEAANNTREPLSCFDEIILCSLSIPTFAKLATLIWDTPLLSICGNALFSGKKITLLKETAPFYNQTNVPSGISDLISLYVKRLESFGITFITKDDLLKKADNIIIPNMNNQLSPAKGKTILTQDDIYSFKTRGEKRIYLEKGSIVTPLARDSAIDLGIELIERG